MLLDLFPLEKSDAPDFGVIAKRGVVPLQSFAVMPQNTADPGMEVYSSWNPFGLEYGATCRLYPRNST